MTSGWTARVPSGWNCVGGAKVTSGILGLSNSEGWIIVVAAVTAKDAATACVTDFQKPSVTVTAQPDTLWGGKTAMTTLVSVGLSEQARCVESKGIVYRLMAELPVSASASIVVAADSLTASWVWK